LLRVIKDFAREAPQALATVRNTSMHGVGTKLGTVFEADAIDAIGRSSDSASCSKSRPC
jgi:hypothetical protein